MPTSTAPPSGSVAIARGTPADESVESGGEAAAVRADDRIIGAEPLEERHRYLPEAFAVVRSGPRHCLDDESQRTLDIAGVERSDHDGELARGAKLVEQGVGPRRSKELIEKDIDERSRPCTREIRYDPAVAERLDCRDATDRVLLRQGWIRVDIHLHEQDGALSCLDRSLEHGSESVTGATPLGPEVDEHRCLGRPGDDILAEGCLGNVQRDQRSPETTTSAAHPAMRAAGTCSNVTPASER